MCVEQQQIVDQAKSLVHAFILTLLESRKHLLYASVLDDVQDALDTIGLLKQAMADARDELSVCHWNLSKKMEHDR